MYENSTQTLVCTSTGGPATSIAWSRDDTPLVVDGTTYDHSQIITDTNTATYQNRLRIVQGSSDGVYTCTVSNSRGRNSAQLMLGGIVISPEDMVAVGWEKDTISCEYYLSHKCSLFLPRARMRSEG